MRDYGFSTKASRLSLKAFVQEATQAITGFQLLVAEEKQANGTRWIRQQIDQQFAEIKGWTKVASGGIDWTKTNRKGATVGVEVQVSGRSDMLAVDIMHLKEDLVLGKIDVGIIVVPDDMLSKFLTDRTPNLATALKHVEHRASDLPIRVLAFKHDGVGPALGKMRTNVGRFS
jgi:hypothetical protein